MKIRLLFLLVPGLAAAGVGCGRDQAASSNYSADAAPPPGLEVSDTPEMDVPDDAPPAGIDFTAPREVGSDGEPVSDLALLNEALERLTMSYEDDGTSTEGPSKLRAVMQSIRDPNDLVRLRLIKSVPTPPPGKQYRMDSKAAQFILVDAP